MLGLILAALTLTVQPVSAGYVRVTAESAAESGSVGQPVQWSVWRCSSGPISCVVAGFELTGPRTIGVTVSDGQWMFYAAAPAEGGRVEYMVTGAPAIALECPSLVGAYASFAVTVNGGESSADWVALFLPGQAAEDYGPWQWVLLPRPAYLSVAAPGAGRYEVRLFSRGGYRQIGACTVVAQ